MAGDITILCCHGTGDDDASNITVMTAIVFAMSTVTMRQSGIAGSFVQKGTAHVDERGAAITYRTIAVILIAAMFSITVVRTLALDISPVVTGFSAATVVATMVTAGFMASG